MLSPRLVREPSPVEKAAPEMPTHWPMVSSSAPVQVPPDNDANTL